MRARHSDSRSTQCYGTRTLGRPNPHGDIYACLQCGWGVTCPLPDEQELRELYSSAEENSYLHDTASRMVMFSRELDAISAEISSEPQSLLDIGCSYGLLLRVAAERGLHAMGLEPSEHATDWCRKSGLEVRRGGLEKLTPGERFDAVFLWDVLEHLRDPAKALVSVGAHMHSGGIVSIVVPDRSSFVARFLGEKWWSVLDLHLHYPTKRGLRNLLTKCGFTIVHVSTHPKRVTPAMLAGWLPGRFLSSVVEKVLPSSVSLVIDPKDQILVRARVL